MFVLRVRELVLLLSLPVVLVLILEKEFDIAVEYAGESMVRDDVNEMEPCLPVDDRRASGGGAMDLDVPSARHDWLMFSCL